MIDPDIFFSDSSRVFAMATNFIAKLRYMCLYGTTAFQIAILILKYSMQYFAYILHKFDEDRSSNSRDNICTFLMRRQYQHIQPNISAANKPIFTKFPHW